MDDEDRKRYIRASLYRVDILSCYFMTNYPSPFVEFSVIGVDNKGESTKFIDSTYIDIQETNWSDVLKNKIGKHIIVKYLGVDKDNIELQKKYISIITSGVYIPLSLIIFLTMLTEKKYGKYICPYCKERDLYKGFYFSINMFSCIECKSKQ